MHSGQIVGSTELESVGSGIEELGLALEHIADGERGFHARVNGRKFYCVFKEAGSNYIGRVISASELYGQIPGTTAVLAACLIAIVWILSYAVTKYMNRYVVAGVHCVNEKLHRIAQRNLDETVDINSSVEFSESSHYINMMKKSLLDYNAKMSYVLRKTNMFIGVYEYNEHIKRVRFTEYIPHIFAEEERDKDALTGLYNRHGMETKITALFGRLNELGEAAVIMIDADNLKMINDTHGHERGGVYLQKISELIAGWGKEGVAAARLGGDEFVLFLYQYDNEKELIDMINQLENAQNSMMAVLDQDISVPLRFSMGYRLVKGNTDYQSLLKEADEQMYRQKRQRKEVMSGQD